MMSMILILLVYLFLLWLSSHTAILHNLQVCIFFLDGRASEFIHPHDRDDLKCVFSRLGAQHIGCHTQLIIPRTECSLPSPCLTKGWKLKNELWLKSVRCYKCEVCGTVLVKDNLAVCQTYLSIYLCTRTQLICTRVVSTRARTQMELNLLTFLWAHHNSTSKRCRGST